MHPLPSQELAATDVGVSKLYLVAPHNCYLGGLLETLQHQNQGSYK